MHLKLITISALALVLALFPACKKEGTSTGEIGISITSHKSGDSVARPIPMKISGSIEGYEKLSEEKKSGINIYLVEQSKTEKIWHVEPKAAISGNGTWTGVTWLGNARQGRREMFTVCAFATMEDLKLKNGNHPVDQKPASIGETCIELKRSR
ncbi:MAG: hypothetical protein MUD12_12035 [Spirochaetes bacterium]|jgi:hypothetical protein|nr:hypothetical protein [Spirochaetota bacterium]